MNRKRTLTITALILFLLFLVVAGLEKGTHLFDFRFVQFQSSFYFIVVLLLSFGAFSMFVLFTMFPPREIPARMLSMVRPGRQAVPVSSLQEAVLAMEMGKGAAALQLLEGINPGDPEYSAGRRMLGDLAAADGRTEQAEFHYQESLKSATGPARGPVILAIARLQEDQKPEAARDLYREAARLFPDAPEPVLRLRSLAVATEDWEDAMKWQVQLEERFPEVLASPEEDSVQMGLRYELAVQEFERGAYKNSQALLKYILRTTDSFTPAYLLSGEIHEKLDNSSAAVKTWERGFQATENPVLLQRVCEALLMENLPERAVEHFQRAARESPGPSVEYCLADLYLKLEMVREAMPLLERLHAQYPDWMLNTRTLADLYFRTREFRKAAELFSSLFKDTSGQHPWKCTSCEATYERYRGRCGECCEWNTVHINTNEAGISDMNEKTTAYPF